MAQLNFRLESDPASEELRILAEVGGSFAGLLTASYRPGATHAELGAVVVEAAHRRRGVASALLRTCARVLAAGGAKTIEAWYDGSRVDTATIEGLLAKAGWERPIPGMVLVRATRRVLDAPWAKVDLAQDDHLAPWSEVTEAELEGLRGATWYPEALGPFPREPIEPVNSLALRHRGLIIGWMLTHRTGPQVIRYSRLFLHPDHRIHARGVSMIVEAIRRQDAAGIPFGTFGVRSDNLAMRRFVERRMAPYVESIKESTLVTKNLP